MNKVLDNKDKNAPPSNLEIENEIIELIFMGKITFQKDN